MNPHVKRLNLSFDLRREEDRQAYEILSKFQHKTAYVIQTVLAYRSSRSSEFSREDLKQMIGDILRELNVEIHPHSQTHSEDLPDAVFSIFEQL